MSGSADGRVGVVIPSYNHADYVGQAVRSVLEQSHDDVELVVVDDGSSDHSCEVIRDAFAAFPGREAALIEQENRGAHSAIMRGIERLDTPMCAVLNSDDLYETDRFETMLPQLQNSKLGIAFSGLRVIDELGDELPADHAWTRWYAGALKAVESEPTIGFALLLHNFSVTSGNFVFTRALYDRLGGFGDQKFAHDWDFLIRATALTEPVFVRDPLMRYRIHGSNTTESVRSLLSDECWRALKQFVNIVTTDEQANSVAPGAKAWPNYWRRFGERHLFFDPETCARQADWYRNLSIENSNG
ncbi:MAG: glycosyltransferase family 2 protein [Phycisphaerales bacterium]